MVAKKESCVKPTQGPILPVTEGQSSQPVQKKEESKMLAKVGKPAPDFEATAYLNGGFKNVKLSDYKGKWIVICFYPGDFTFV